MQASIPLGRIARIPIGLHYSWFIIAGLITFSLAAHFGAAHPDWAVSAVWGLATLTAILFFVSLVAHEMSHALVARARGLPVRSITLFALGGVAVIERDANSAKTEFLVAVVGPITSFTIGFVCIAAAQAMGWTLEDGGAGMIATMLGWLGSINVLLAAFNLVPGFPLDGGRILRAILWWIYGDGDRATRSAARVGQGFAGLLIAFGVLQFFAGAGIGGLWLVFIGWFLMMAAQASYAQVTVTEALRGIRVGDVMTNECETLDPNVDLQTLVDEVVLRRGRRCVMVRSGDRVVGLVTPHEVRAVDRANWSGVTLGDIMRPLRSLKTVTPDTPVAEAFATMAREDLNQLPVMSDGDLAGMVSRGQILQIIQTRSELGA